MSNREAKCQTQNVTDTVTSILEFWACGDIFMNKIRQTLEQFSLETTANCPFLQFCLATQAYLGLLKLMTGSPLPKRMFTITSACSLSGFTSRWTRSGGIWKKSPFPTSTALAPFTPY